jgi:hypothetical protein
MEGLGVPHAMQGAQQKGEQRAALLARHAWLYLQRCVANKRLPKLGNTRCQLRGPLLKRRRTVCWLGAIVQS